MGGPYRCLTPTSNRYNVEVMRGRTGYLGIGWAGRGMEESIADRTRHPLY